MPTKLRIIESTTYTLDEYGVLSGDQMYKKYEVRMDVTDYARDVHTILQQLAETTLRCARNNPEPSKEVRD